MRTGAGSTSITPGPSPSSIPLLLLLFNREERREMDFLTHKSVQASAATGVLLACLTLATGLPWWLWAAWAALTAISLVQAARA